MPLSERPGPFAGQIRIGELFQSERADARQIVGSAKFRRPFRRRVTGGANRAVRIVIKALAVVADVRRRSAARRPVRLIRSSPTSSHCAMRSAQSACVCCRSVFDLANLPRADSARFICSFRRINDARRFVVVIQEREHAVIFLLRERIEFVVVALRALDRQAENAFADAIHAIEHRVHAELFRIDAAFFVEHGVAQKAGGDDLVLRRVRQLVARDLFDDKLVVRQVA